MMVYMLSSRTARDTYSVPARNLSTSELSTRGMTATPFWECSPLKRVWEVTVSYLGFLNENRVVPWRARS